MATRPPLRWAWLRWFFINKAVQPYASKPSAHPLLAGRSVEPRDALNHSNRGQARSYKPLFLWERACPC